MNLYIVPCSAAKAAAPTKAADLYLGTMFRSALATAKALAKWDEEQGTDAKVMILSALHGLVGLDEVVAPYEMKMGKPGSVDAAELVLQIEVNDLVHEDDDVYALLPHAYFDVLDEALRHVRDYGAHDIYEVNAGIGDQKRINNLCARGIS